MLLRVILMLACLAGPVWAVEPSEVLDDPALEARARALSAELRCPVCRNENIDASNATLAKDLRIILRERLVAGDTDEQAVSYLVQRYGEFILLKPDVTGANWLLWGAPPLMLLLALGIGWGAIRRRPTTPSADTLSDEEKARLVRLLDN